MRRLEKAFRGVVRDLNELGRSFALLGGFAVSAQVEPRTTRDVDLAVLVDGDPDAESLAFALSQRGYALETTVEHTGTGRLATARTTSRSGAIVDLLFASSGIEPEIVSAAEEIEILDGFRVPVATIAHLIAMKVLARDDRTRPQDVSTSLAFFEKPPRQTSTPPARHSSSSTNAATVAVGVFSTTSRKRIRSTNRVPDVRRGRGYAAARSTWHEQTGRRGRSEWSGGRTVG